MEIEKNIISLLPITYQVSTLFKDNTNPKAIKCTIIEVPPWLIKGRGTPTTGKIPLTMQTFTTR